MIGVGQFATLETVLEGVEAAITALVFTDAGTDAASYNLLDRLDQWAHLGVIVSSPSSVETEQLRKARWVEDTIAVELRVSVARTPGQREGRDAATNHEMRIRDAVEAAIPLRRHRPRWTRSARQLQPDKAWLALVQTFTVTRFEPVHQVA